MYITNLLSASYPGYISNPTTIKKQFKNGPKTLKDFSPQGATEMINKHIRRCPMSLQDATSQPFGRKLQKISQQVTSVGEGVEKLDPVPMGSQNDGAGMVQYTT